MSLFIGFLFFLFIWLLWAVGCTLVFSGIYYLICLLLGWTFSWPICIGIFLICLVLRWVLSAVRGTKE